jgi:hypothetical protein
VRRSLTYDFNLKSTVFDYVDTGAAYEAFATPVGPRTHRPQFPQGVPQFPQGVMVSEPKSGPPDGTDISGPAAGTQSLPKLIVSKWEDTRDASNL